MAKKRKSKKSSANEVMGSSPMSMDKSADAGIEQAENGFIVRVSSNGLKKTKQGEGSYQYKRYVAMDHPTALRIASEGFAGLARKVGKGKKSSGGKKAASRKRV